MAKHNDNCNCEDDVCLTDAGLDQVEAIARLAHEGHDNAGPGTCRREPCRSLHFLITGF